MITASEALQISSTFQLDKAVNQINKKILKAAEARLTNISLGLNVNDRQREAIINSLKNRGFKVSLDFNPLDLNYPSILSVSWDKS